MPEIIGTGYFFTVQMDPGRGVHTATIVPNDMRHPGLCMTSAELVKIMFAMRHAERETWFADCNAAKAAAPPAAAAKPAQRAKPKPKAKKRKAVRRG